jgi:hypothetical protein
VHQVDKRKTRVLEESDSGEDSDQDNKKKFKPGINFDKI